MKKILYSIIIIIMTLITIQGALATPTVTHTDNLITITSWEYAKCKGTTCTYEFTIENHDSVNRFVDVSNLFDKDIQIKKFERYQEIEIIKEINTPYVCGWYEEFNQTLQNITIYCDNIITQETTQMGWAQLPHTKYNKQVSVSSQKILLNKNLENTFRVTTYQPLGQQTKFDIITDNWDETKTILDPWINTDTYIINYTSTKYGNLHTGLLNVYRFENASWIDDIQGNSFTNASGSRNVQTGIKGNSIDCNSNVIETTDVWLNYTTDYTISYWFNEPSGAYVIQGGWLYPSYGQFEILANGSSRYYMTDHNNANAIYSHSKSALDDGTWHHNIYMWDNDTESIIHYIDGVEQFNESVGAPFTRHDTHGLYMTICGRHDNNSLNYDSFASGTIDELYFWNRELTNTEITALSENQTHSYYPFVNTNYDKTNNIGEQTNFTTTYTGVQVILNSLITSINDTALGTELLNNTCYNIISGQTEFNYSIDLSTTEHRTQTNLVNYTFKDCSTGGGSSGGIGGGTAEEIRTIPTIIEAIQLFIQTPDLEHINGIFTSMEYELSLLLTTPVSTSNVNENTYVFSNDPKQNLRESGNNFLDDPNGTNLWILIKSILHYLFGTNTSQIIN